MKKLLAAIILGAVALVPFVMIGGAAAADTFPVPKGGEVLNLADYGTVPKAGNTESLVRFKHGTVSNVTRDWAQLLRKKHYRVAVAPAVKDGTGRVYTQSIAYAKGKYGIGAVEVLRGHAVLATVLKNQYVPSLAEQFAAIGFAPDATATT
jgi:phosphoribulokinase